MRRRESDLAVHIFRAHNKDADAWAEQGASENDRWED